MLALLVAAPLASAATFAGGTTRVTISPTFAKFLKNKAKVTVKASGGTLKTFSFKISDGDAALQTNSVGSFDHASTNITFKKGTKTAQLKSIKHVLAGSKGQLTGSLKGQQITLLDEVTAGKTFAAADFTTLNGRGIPAKLSAVAAKKLNAALGLKNAAVLKKGQTVGTVAFDADRSLRFDIGSGTASTELSDEYLTATQNCGIMQTPVAPATQSGKTLSLPVGGGTLNARTLRGTISTSGGVELSKPSDPTAPIRQVFDFAFEFSKSGRSLTAAASVLFGARLTVGDVEGGSVNLALTPEGGTVTFTNLLLKFNSVAAQSLQGDYKCDPPIPAGIELGTVNGSGTVK